jgi:hypothetical protein
MRAERPRVRVDQAWHYAVEDHVAGSRHDESRRVVAVTADTIVTVHATTHPAGINGRFVYTHEWNLIERPALGGADAGSWKWEPPYPHFRFPLEAGRSWSGRATVSNAATDTRNVHRYSVKVQPLRRVTVPAGTYDALPVAYQADVLSDAVQQQLAWKVVETLDYAPDADAFVQYSGRITAPDGKLNRHWSLRLTRIVR